MVTNQDIIEAAADNHDIDLDRAITSKDSDPTSDRIYLLEEQPGGYRLIHFGIDADGFSAEPEQPLFIPDSAVGGLQALLHAAGLHQAHDSLIDGSTRLRDVSEGMGVSKPMEPASGDQ